MNHDWILDHVPMDKSILRKWLKSGVIDRGQFKATTEGSPQGGIISPAVANWTLNGLETKLIAHLKAKFGTIKTEKLKVGVTRYADDFIVTGISKELLEAEIKPWIESFLAERGLKLSAEKTRVVHINEGFDFLGWNFRKYSDKLLIKPSKKNVQTFYEKLRKTIGANLMAKQEDLIRLLNPMLRGWAQYHRHVVAKKTFARLESQLYWRLWSWAKRRHPNKSAAWIRRKYWQSAGERNWVFAADVRSEDGSRETVELYSLSATPIERHRKVQGGFNPYDPDWEMYGETLRQNRMLKSMRYQKEWVKLYADQLGKCGLCGHAMDIDTGWHDHHIVRRVDGGSNALSNRVLLHPTCHQRVHSLDLKVVKPASN
jgi:RNA-directed DNA polymerase